MNSEYCQNSEEEGGFRQLQASQSGILAAKQEKVLEVINRFGVISSTQLVDYLEGEISHVTVYNTKKKLLSLGFITEKKIGYTLVLAVRPRGVDYLGSPLTPFTKLNFGMSFMW